MKRGFYILIIVFMSSSITIWGQTATDYFNNGFKKNDIKNYKEAIEDFTKAIELNPNDEYSYANRGLSLYYLKRYQEAINDYTKAIEINPTSPLEYYNRAGCLNALGRYQEAINDYTKSIEINPNSATTYKCRGINFYYLGRYQEAINDYTKSIEINPNFSEVYMNRGYTLYLLKRFKEAIQDYNKIISVNSKDAYSYYYRGSSLETLEHYNEAIDDYTKAIILDPNFALAKSNLEKLKGKMTGNRTPKIWIVTVGIDNYKYNAPFSPLRASVSNTYKFKDIFLLANLTDQEQIETLSNDEADRQNILSTIQNKLCDNKLVYPEDMVVFYFVGHGMALDKSFGICPYDFINNNQLISETEIIDLLQSSPARHKFCFIESCKSENTQMGTTSVSPESLKLFNQSRERYGNSITVITSTQVGGVSYEYAAMGGIFSHFLLMGLKGKADGYSSGEKDNIISTRELFDYINEYVMNQTSKIQKPQINKAAYEADIPIIPVIEK